MQLTAPAALLVPLNPARTVELLKDNPDLLEKAVGLRPLREYFVSSHVAITEGAGFSPGFSLDLAGLIE
jgi:hypothetical protein